MKNRQAILFMLGMMFSVSVLAAGEKAGKSENAKPDIQNLPTVPELSADAKKLLAQVNKRISSIDTKEFVA